MPRQRNGRWDERVLPDDRCDLLCLDLQRAEAIRQHLNAETIETAAARAKALGDPTRLTLALALREGGEPCVCDLAWIAARAANLVGHQDATRARWIRQDGFLLVLLWLWCEISAARPVACGMLLASQMEP